LLDEFQPKQTYTTPAVKECFKYTSSAALDVDGQKKFHTMVAKLLYLAKRARPDILTADSFLCTKVTKPTKEDQKKLVRVMRYIKQSTNYKYIIEPTKPL
jgi:tryptophanyl-tRNA synthetase